MPFGFIIHLYICNKHAAGLNMTKCPYCKSILTMFADIVSKIVSKS